MNSNSINFLHEQESNLLDKFIQWMLTYGRVVVMLTYFIAFCAWGYRFTIDYQLSDIHDQIKNNEIIIKNSSSQETLYRNLQNRLLFAKNINQKGQISIQPVMDLISNTKGNVTLTSVTATSQNIQTTVSTNSIQGLNAFVSDLRDLSYVTDVNISSIENKVSSGEIDADISINLSPTMQTTIEPVVQP